MKLTQVIPSISLVAGALAFPASGHEGDQLIELKRDQKAPKRVLTPAVHWNIATNKNTHVRAAKTQSLYYAESTVADPNVKHHFGHSNVTYTVPTVNVDYADAVTLDKDSDGVKVTFADASAYKHAVDTWSGHDKLLLMTYAPICDDYQQKKYCYVLTTGLQFDEATSTATAHGEAVDGADYLDKIDFEYGVYSPPQKAPAGAQIKRANTNSPKSYCSAKDSKYGLPVVTTGDSFDKRLDDCRGYSKASLFSWYKYATSLGADQEAHGKLTVDKSPDLEGVLGLFKGKAAKDAAIAKANAQGGKKTSRSIETRDLMKRGWLSWLPVKIPLINSPISKDFNKDLSYSLPADRGQDASPWGKAKLLYRKTGQKTSTGTNGKGSGSVSADGSISIYCVDCGASGSVSIYGKGSYSVDSGLTEGFVKATVNVNIGFSLGMDIQATLTAQANQQIANFGVPGLSFGIITIGPILTVGADFNFFANAEGKLLAGAKFQIINAVSTLDFVNTKNSGSSGWTPVFTPIFEASGQVAVGAEIGLPLAISVGVDIANGKYVKSAGLIERPTLEAKAEFAATADTTGAKITKTDGCAGIATQITFKNELYADVIGQKFSLMAPYVKTLTKGCIPIGKQAGAAAFDVPTIAAANSVTNSKFSGYAVAGYNTTGALALEYTELVDSTKGFILATCPDSNVYLQARANVDSLTNKTCSRIFETRGSSIVGDGFSRLFHYYTDSMSAAGVSRLRVHRDNDIPAGTQYVNFNAYTNSTAGLKQDKNIDADGPNAKAYFVATDASGNRFYPALCSYSAAGLTTKVFLVKDPVKGLTTLMDESLQGSVTGGKVTGCYLLPLKKPASERGNNFDNAYAVDQGTQGASQGAALDAVTDF